MRLLTCWLMTSIVILQSAAINAQPNIKSLKKGDQFNAITLKDREGKDVSFSAEDGQLLIIDFWNVNCTGCAKAFMKLDTLQSVFKDSIKIISVTYSKEDQVVKFFQKIKRSFPTYPMIVNDTLMKQIFPHEGDPYYAWVRNGRVLHLTNSSSLTEEHVRDILAGKKLRLGQRLQLPLFKFDQSFLAATLAMRSYGLLLRGLENYQVGYGGGQIVYDSITRKPIYLKAGNNTRLELLLRAYWEDIFGFEAFSFKLPRSRIFIDSSARELIQRPEGISEDDWLRENRLSVELKIDPDEGEDLYKEMQSLLAKHLPYEVKLETKELPAILIEVADSALFKKVQTIYGNGKASSAWSNNYMDLRNVSIKNSLIRILMHGALWEGKLPYVNNTGYDGLISMRVDGDIYDEASLGRELLKFGLRLRKTVHPLLNMTIRKR